MQTKICIEAGVTFHEKMAKLIKAIKRINALCRTQYNGQQFSTQTISLIENFIKDTKKIKELIDNG